MYPINSAQFQSNRYLRRAKRSASRAAVDLTVTPAETGAFVGPTALEWTDAIHAGRRRSVSRSKMNQLLSSGQMPYTRVGADRRIPKSALEVYLAMRLVRTEGRG